MKISIVRKAAFAFVASMPLLLILCTALAAWRWSMMGRWVPSLHESLWFAMLFAGYMATTRNPFRAMAAGLAYLPIGTMFAMEPYTPARNHGGAGLIYLASPVFVLFVVIVAFIGGVIMKFVFDAFNKDRG